MLRWLKKNKLSRKISKRRLEVRKFSRSFKRKANKVFKKITKIFRKIFEYRRIRQVLGGNILSVAVLLSQISAPASALQAYPQPELVALPQVEVETEAVETATKVGFQVPVEFGQISQGYHLFHLAIDLAAPIGKPVKPIAQGRVERVEHGRWGYGNSLLINHGSGLKSFYAHMSRIKVENGQEVDVGKTIGTVGASGRATGPHLHLEIWQNDRPLNPRVVLDLQPSVPNLAEAK